MDASANVVATQLEAELQAFRDSCLVPRLDERIKMQLTALLATGERWTNEVLISALNVCAETLIRSRRGDDTDKFGEMKVIESVFGCPANGAFLSLVLFPEAPSPRDSLSFKKSLQIPLQACLAESSLLTFDGKHPSRKAPIPTPPIDSLAAEPSASARPQDPKAASVWGRSGTSGAAKLFNGSASALAGQAAPAPAVPAPSPAHQAPAIRKSGGAQRPTFEPEICTLFVSGIPESWDLGKICKEHLGIRTLRVNLIPPRVANPGRKLNTVRFFSRSDALKALGALNELRTKECPSLLAKVAERDMEVNPRQRASARGTLKSTGPAKSPAKPSAAAQTGAMSVDALPNKAGSTKIHYPPASPSAQNPSSLKARAEDKTGAPTPSDAHDTSRHGDTQLSAAMLKAMLQDALREMQASIEQVQHDSRAYTDNLFRDLRGSEASRRGRAPVSDQLEQESPRKHSLSRSRSRSRSRKFQTLD